jgi:phosphatidylserine decarboxylase
MACCIGAVVLWALSFPHPSPIVKPFLSPKLRWPEGQIREWATTGDFDADYWRYFTRDPQRTIPAGPNIVAPADGLLRYIDHKDGWTYVVIAMSFWDVHVQRSPCAATVLSMEDAGDTFMDGEGNDLVYLREKVCPVQKILHLDTEWGPFVLRLITSVSARRLETWVSPGEKLKKGQRLGRILAGSTVVLEMPDSLQLDVSVGERMVAGESILYSSAEVQ